MTLVGPACCSAAGLRLSLRRRAQIPWAVSALVPCIGCAGGGERARNRALYICRAKSGACLCNG